MVEVGRAERVKERGGLRDLIVREMLSLEGPASSSSPVEVVGGSTTGTCGEKRQRCEVGREGGGAYVDERRLPRAILDGRHIRVRVAKLLSR